VVACWDDLWISINSSPDAAGRNASHRIELSGETWQHCYHRAQSYFTSYMIGFGSIAMHCDDRVDVVRVEETCPARRKAEVAAALTKSGRLKSTLQLAAVNMVHRLSFFEVGYKHCFVKY
jgi:hypothetical protein